MASPHSYLHCVLTFVLTLCIVALPLGCSHKPSHAGSEVQTVDTPAVQLGDTSAAPPTGFPVASDDLSLYKTSSNMPLPGLPDPIDPDNHLARLGYLDVTLYGADPTGAEDSTEAIQNAVKDAYEYGLVCFFSLRALTRCQRQFTAFRPYINCAGRDTTMARPPVSITGILITKPIFLWAPNNTVAP